MDELSREAVEGLSSAVAALLAEAGLDGPAPAVEVLPRRLGGLGIGDVVGLHDEPRGEVLGRRLDAEVRVTVAAGGDAGAVARALVGAGRRALAGRGIQALRLRDAAAAPAAEAGAEAGDRLAFAVRYEHLRTPAEAGGVIAEVPLELGLVPGGAPAAVRFRRALGAGSLALFEVFDDDAATTGGPSAWVENAAEERIEQRSGIRGGSFLATPNKPGTYAVLRGVEAADLVLQATVRSDDGDGIGVVFRWQGPDDFYFFLMTARNGHRMIAKKVAGAFLPLDVPALDESRGYTVGVPHALEVTARGRELAVRVDGGPRLAGEDASLAAPGRVGLTSFGDDRSFFFRLGLVTF